jgi:thiosulfate/3-mercaptopyruvate sulfurtransferase
MAIPPSVVVDASWVRAHLDDLMLADLRWYLDGRDGRAAYESGHVPGALYVDLEHDLSSPDKGGRRGRHPLPSPAEFAAALGRLGIAADDTVVAYDDSGGGTAGRLVWMLTALGQPAALMDGGLAAWDGPLETGPSVPRLPVFVHERPWPADRLADADELTTGAAVVLDARSVERYRGETEPVDARAGHVPGAASAPWLGNLDAGRFLSPARLRDRFAAFGIDEGTDVIAYCGSGVSACANLLALEHAGLGRGRLYVASWSGWAADPARPVATGEG